MTCILTMVSTMKIMAGIIQMEPMITEAGTAELRERPQIKISWTSGSE